MLQELVYFIICFICTTLGAISGIGGGVIIKPLMDAVSGMNASTVSFLAGLTVEAMAIVSIAQHFVKKESTTLEPRRGTLLAVGSVAGGIAGKSLFSWFKALTGQEQAVAAGQNIVLFLLTVLVFVYYIKKSAIQTKNVQSNAACLGVGLVLGLLSAFLGIGGGPINLMVLSYLFSMDAKTAALHSLYIILFSQTASLATTLLSASVPVFGWVTLIAMALGGVLGAFSGRSLNRRLSNQGVDKLFMGMLVIILGICLYNTVRFMA